MKIVKPDDEGLKYAASIIRKGGVAIYPTETVYGLGCVPSDPDATKRILQIKERADKPLPLICSSMEIVNKIVEFNNTARKLAERFWPGPLMMILPKKIDYPIWVTHGKKTLGIRIPGNDISRKLAKYTAGVLVSTSANKSGANPPLTAKEAINQLGREIDVVVDAGPSQGQLPSTILDVSSDQMWILRSGPITRKMILETLKN
jgi:L-threonylcarbamoyladenylate synthase